MDGGFLAFINIFFSIVGPRLLGDMLPALCSAVNQPRCTNHQLRCTAIIFMRRAGLPWLTIAKITGHQSVENLIKHYDLSLEVRGEIYSPMLLFTLHIAGRGAS